MCEAKSAFVSFLKIGDEDDKDIRDIEAGPRIMSSNSSAGKMLTCT